MENNQLDNINLKKAKGQLAINMSMVIPLVEEITKNKVLPFCLIGFSVGKKGRINAHFSTLHDSHDDSVYLICKQFCEHYLSNNPHLAELEKSEPVKP